VFLDAPYEARTCQFTSRSNQRLPGLRWIFAVEYCLLVSPIPSASNHQSLFRSDLLPGRIRLATLTVTVLHLSIDWKTFV